ncbi:Mss4-like protein [Aspergillus californicus]
MLHSISCLCAKVAQKVQLEPSGNDGSLDFCHCAACQETTGQISFSYRLLQAKPQLDSTKEYQQSNSISRYFCETCGSHVFAYSIHTGHYFVASGLLDSPPQTEKVRHWGTADTQDGGLSSFLPGDFDTTVPCWLTNGQGTFSKIKSEGSTQNPSQLFAQCHCRGIELYITPPDSTSEQAWSPWPDLIIPYNSGVNADNEDNVKWWLRAGKTKYMAGTCVCRTCRQASGFPIQTWAFVPKSNILTAQKSPLAYGVGTMKRYNSSPGVYREFCGRCGASIFWHCDQRPLLIDVSVGILRAQSGSRAEELLEWVTGRVSFAEMAVDNSLIQLLEGGLKAHGQQ